MNTPMIINERVSFNIEISYKSEMKFDDLKFELKLENKNEKSHAKIGINFYQVYLTKLFE